MTKVISVNFGGVATDIQEVPEVFFFANPTSSEERIISKWSIHNSFTFDPMPCDYTAKFREFVKSSINRGHLYENPQEIMRDLCSAAISNGIETLSELAEEISVDFIGDDLRSMFMDYISGDHPFLGKPISPLHGPRVAGRQPR